MQIRRILAALLIIFIIFFGKVSAPVTLQAAPEEAGLTRVFTTYYIENGQPCKSGIYPREGICAGKEEWLGKTCLIYADEGGRNGPLLKICEVMDTGFGGDSDGDGIGTIQEGRTIDVYFETKEEGQEWMELTGGHVWIQIIDAEG